MFCDQICEIYKNHDVPFAEICVTQNIMSPVLLSEVFGNHK